METSQQEKHIRKRALELVRKMKKIIDEGNFNAHLHQLFATERGEIRNYLASNPDVTVLANLYGETLLHYVSVEGRLDIVEALFESGADLNNLNDSNRSPLMDCCKICKEEMIDFLLSKGASMYIENTLDGDAFYVAISSSCDYAVNRFVEMGYNINSCSAKERSPLMYAAQLGNVQMIKLLIDLGADLNFRNHFNETALFHSAWHHQDKAYSLLVSLGADATFTSSRFALNAIDIKSQDV